MPLPLMWHQLRKSYKSEHHLWRCGQLREWAHGNSDPFVLTDPVVGFDYPDVFGPDRSLSVRDRLACRSDRSSITPVPAKVGRTTWYKCTITGRRSPVDAVKKDFLEGG